MITFVPCNIFERIQYSEFILVRISLDEIKNLNLSGNEISTKRPIDSDETEKSATKRFSLSLPAPKNSFIDDRTDKGTGKSLSGALIFESTNPQYDNRLFIELPLQYMKITSSEHGENMLCTQIVFVLTFRTIYVNNMFSPYSELAIFMY